MYPSSESKRSNPLMTGDMFACSLSGRIGRMRSTQEG
jgi:hypothetical protein